MLNLGLEALMDILASPESGWGAFFILKEV